MKRPLSIVIFSKDRAAQLDLCLKSIYSNLNSLSKEWIIDIIYTSSSEEFEMGYKEIRSEWEEYPFISFYPESFGGGFKQTLERRVDHWGDYVLFFTDDDIVYRKFEHSIKEIEASIGDKENLCLCLRLGSNTFVQDQYRNTKCIIPEDVFLSEDTIRFWEWKKQGEESNFSYPFSLDGHVYKIKDVKYVLDNTPGYYNPNSLEGKAHYYHVKTDLGANLPDKMSCFEKSYVVNTPLNRVQETCTNSAGKFFGQSPEELNTSVLKGSRLCLEKMEFDTIIGVHQELKLFWGEKQ